VRWRKTIPTIYLPNPESRGGPSKSGALLTSVPKISDAALIDLALANT
jgi:hypothetical protein